MPNRLRNLLNKGIWKKEAQSERTPNTTKERLLFDVFFAVFGVSGRFVVMDFLFKRGGKLARTGAAAVLGLLGGSAIIFVVGGCGSGTQPMPGFGSGNSILLAHTVAGTSRAVGTRLRKSA